MAGLSCAWLGRVSTAGEAVGHILWVHMHRSFPLGAVVEATRAMATPALLLPFLLVCFSFAAGASSDNSVSVAVEPDPLFVSPDEAFSVDLTIDPPSASTASWIVDVTYDPAVLQYESCRGLDPLPGAVQASDCRSLDSDTVSALGAALYSRSQLGLSTRTRVATFTFAAIGVVGAQSPLTVSVRHAVDSDGESQQSVTHDGSVSIIALVPGDINCDGDADPHDAVTVLGVLSGVRPVAACWGKADANHDDHVDALDALMILTQSAGIA